MTDPQRLRVGRTDLSVFPLCLGGNVFGWTADRQQSIEILDAYVAGGGNFIDTADSYAAWVPGNHGGESEAMIGAWMASRGNRDQMVVATKVGEAPGTDDLSTATVHRAAEASLRRLQTDYIDLYYVHRDRPDAVMAETLDALDALVRAGKVRYLAASNFGPVRLAEALATSDREGFARYAALQPLYNLADRDYERELQPLCAREGVACFPFRSLAKGFLTGKYRPQGARVDSAHTARALAYLDARGAAILGALDEVARVHRTTVASVALAWLAAQPTVVAPIASVSAAAQLPDLLGMTELRLSAEELDRLGAAGPVVSAMNPAARRSNETVANRSGPIGEVGDDDVSSIDDQYLGNTLRALRQSRDLSLADVARETQISASFLSLVENGKSDMSLGRLTRLMQFYGISFSDLLPPPRGVDPDVVRRDERHVVHSRTEGIDIFLLTPDTNRGMITMLLEFAPGSARNEHGIHAGEEFVHVLQGELILELGGRVHQLKAGDSAYYAGDRPHLMRNASNHRRLRVLCVDSSRML